MALTVCPDCDGDGEVQVGTTTWRESHGEFVTDAVMGECLTCRGLGAVLDDRPEPITLEDADERSGLSACEQGGAK